MTREQAIQEVNKVFEPAFANYIIIALTEGATVSDKEQEPVYFPPCVDCNTKMNEIREAYDKLKKQEPCEELFDDWREAPSYAMTLEQAREAVHELRKEIVKLRKEPCEDAIIIPRGATNGDVLTTIFPDLNFTNVLAKMYAQNGKMLLEWWNTPYKRTEG